MAKSEGILRLLIVDDSMSDADAVINNIRSTGHAVRATREQSLAGVETELRERNFDLIVCRDTMTDFSPADVVELSHDLVKDIPIIILASNTDNLSELFSIGASDIVDFGDIVRLQFVVNRELNNLMVRRKARRNERALRESEKRSHALLESSRDAVAYMHQGMHIYVNSAYLSLFGYDEVEDIDGLPFLDMIQDQDHLKFKSVYRQFLEQADNYQSQTINVNCLKADGEHFKAQIEFSFARVEGEDCTQVVVRDEVDLLQQSIELDWGPERDFVTGLYSRLHFMDELQQAINKAAEGKGDSESVYLSIDHFEQLKEQISLQDIDLVLKTAATALNATLLDDETIGYYSDSVFVLILPTMAEHALIERVTAFSNAVIQSISAIDDVDVNIKCSAGVARISESVSTAFNALENAHNAYIQAMRRDDDGVKVQRYSNTVVEKVELHAGDNIDSDAWDEKIHHAINNDEFYLYYQPIVSLHGKEQEAYEVLLRFDDIGGRPIKPQELIQHAKQHNLMAEVDRWVIRKALDKLGEHQKQRPKTRFFIKLTQQTMCSDSFVAWLEATLSAHSVGGDSLTFQISETDAVQHLEQTKHTIASLKNLGCEFGLEHFGSGIDFSRSLEELDLTYVKVNGSFVQSMSADSENLAAVQSIVDMTKESGKQSIAEFVSDANSLALLWQLGVDYAQGFYIHEPSEKLDYVFEGEAP